MVYLDNHRSPASLNFDLALRLMYIIECHYTLSYIGRWFVYYIAIGLVFVALFRNVAFRIVHCGIDGWSKIASPLVRVQRRGITVLTMVGTPT